MKRSGANLLGLGVPISLALAACLLTGWALYDLSPPSTMSAWSDLAYKTLRNAAPGDMFDSAGHEGNLKLQAARWIGVVVVAWAMLGVFFLALRTTRIRLMAAMRRNHLVVVGGNGLADRLSEAAAALRIEVIQLQEDGETSVHDELVRLPFTAGNPKSLSGAGLPRARQLIVAVDNDALAADIAIQVQATLPRLNIVTCMNDLWIARHLHILPGAEKLRTFTEATAASREILRRHPPFLTARDLEQKRIHCVLIGDHDWLEALMVEAILSACTLTFGKPAFSFVCLEPGRFRDRLFERYPDIANAAALTFFEARQDEHAPLSVGNFPELGKFGPVTAAYCAMTDDSDSLAAALALRKFAIQDEAWNAPVFVRTLGQGITRPVAGSRLIEGTLVPFGGLTDLAKATGIMSINGEQIEKKWHRAYLELAPDDKSAARPWEELSEEFRISNQRAVGHIYAKLFEAGFDLRPWLATHDPFEELPSLAKEELLFRSDDDRQRLAELEHERWTADRRMSGWTDGIARDDRRKIHNNMVPFDRLTPEIQAYDYVFVDLINKVLKHTRNGLRRYGQE